MRFLCMFVLVCLEATFLMKLSAEPLSCNVNAESAILMNADTGAILFEKDAHILQYPASITKIATAVYALHTSRDKLDTMITAEQEAVVSVTEESKRKSNYSVPSYWMVPGSSHIGIKTGEVLSLKDLLYGMMVASGNDAANVIALHVGGTIPDYMDKVNIYLKEIGCTQTNFNNPHGLHHPKHQTTAYDMAMMTREALKDPIFREIVSTVRYPRPKTNKQESTTLVQTNRLLKKGKNYYSKAIGVKTGYTSQSGSTLVAAAKQGDRTLIAVLLKCKEREETLKDAIALFETAFNQPKVKRILLKAGPQDYNIMIPGAASVITTVLQDDVSVEYYPAEEPKMKCLLYWNTLTPPIATGQKVGEIRLQTDDGKVLQVSPLLAQADVQANWMHSVKNIFSSGKSGSNVWKWIAFGVLSLLLATLILQLRRRPQG